MSSPASATIGSLITIVNVSVFVQLVSSLVNSYTTWKVPFPARDGVTSPVEVTAFIAPPNP